MKYAPGLLFGSLAFFVLWTVATWFFEGRIETLLRPEATGARVIYAFLVNLLLGIAGGILFLRYWRQRGGLEVDSAGFGPRRRTTISVIIGLALGLAVYFLQGAPSTHPVVIVNAFSQVLPVSAAEVLVCWSMVASAIESSLKRRGRWLAVVVAALVASVLFGIYHYAHSPPFNTHAMVVLLTVVGLVTSAFFFISRDLAGTIVFHNFLGTFGVVQALAGANALSSLQQLRLPLIVTALVTAALVAAGYVMLRLRGPRSTGVSATNLERGR